MSSDPKSRTPPAPALTAEEVNQALTRGFLTTHTQMSQQFGNLFQVATTVSALAELLVDKGVLGREELDQRLDVARDRLAQSGFGQGLQFMMQPTPTDKYAARTEPVDCDARRHLCRSACCALDVAISSQDIEEGVVRWDPGRPYLLRRGAEGFCCHLERASGECTVYAQRPLVCRSYSCAADKRIWTDFEQRIPNMATIDALLARSAHPQLLGRDAGAPDAYRTASSLTPGAEREAAEAPQAAGGEATSDSERC